MGPLAVHTLVISDRLLTPVNVQDQKQSDYNIQVIIRKYKQQEDGFGNMLFLTVDYFYFRLCACLRACACLCMIACVSERERETDHATFKTNTGSALTLLPI